MTTFSLIDTKSINFRHSDLKLKLDPPSDFAFGLCRPITRNVKKTNYEICISVTALYWHMHIISIQNLVTLRYVIIKNEYVTPFRNDKSDI